MFINAADLSQANLPPVDLCIVGAGAAGLSMVQRLDGSGLKIVLLESGGDKGRDPVAGALNAGTSPLPDYPFETSRARGFGGTTSLWTGACIRLDADDFQRRDWLPHSGWPIGLNELEPYYNAAAPLFGMVEDAPYLKSIHRSPLHGAGLDARFAQITRQPHFGNNHRALVAKSNDVTCILGGTATGFSVSGSGQQVEAVDVCDTDGRTFQITARMIVLATGGIEVPRQLLRAPPQMRSAMGPAAQNVGRYHMEHPIRSLGVIKVPDARRRVLAFTDLTSTDGADLQGSFGLTEDLRQREGLLNLHCRAYRFHALEDDPAIVQLKDFASQPRVSGSALSRQAKPASLAKSLRYGAWHLWNRASRRARFDHIRLLAFLEQEPDPANRITLGTETDRFGQPLPHLEFTESERMTASVQRTLELIGQALDERGLEKHRLGEDAHLAHYGGYGLHHMGATRMSDLPSDGVVDANCRVHGVNNLYIASSSVFTTGGAANPTLTIAALALRLSDHVQAILSSD